MVTPVSTTTAIIKISIPTMMAGCALLEEYVNDEMNGAHRILDKDGDITAAYMYVIADEYVIGVNGAGWDFYHGVWDKLYDVCGIRWHEYANA